VNNLSHLTFLLPLVEHGSLMKNGHLMSDQQTACSPFETITKTQVIVSTKGNILHALWVGFLLISKG
jgi:hypothetical protein